MLGRLGSGVALAATAALVLVGCAPGPSEEDALASARTTWDGFLDRLVEYGADPASATRDDLLQFSTPEVADVQLENFEQAEDANIHAEGGRRTSNFQPSDLTGSPEALTVSVCVDTSDERVLDINGDDITDPDREELLGFAVGMTSEDRGASYLIDSFEAFDESAEDHPCGG